MIAQNPDDRLSANITHSRAEMPFSVRTIADETGKFRCTRTNKNQTNKHRCLVAMKIFINFSILADQMKPRPWARHVTQRP
jgi:hypothetical protein